MSNIDSIKGLESQLGLYVYGNEGLVDIKHDIDQEVKFTEIHENIHAFLSLGSTYGLVINMLKKISLIDKSKEWIRKEFIENMMSMQECIATCIEYLSILKFEGEESYKVAYGKLKREREYKRYFKAIKNARWIMEDASENNVDEYINILKIIGIASLQIKFNDIPLEAFESKQNMDRVMTHEENVLKYHPNKRCNELLKIFKSICNNEYDEESKEKFKLIIRETAINEEKIDMSRRFVLSLYKDSTLLDKIEKRIVGFKESKIPLYKHDESMAIYPLNLNDSEIIDYTLEVVRLDEIETLIQEKLNGFFFINNRIGALEEIHLIGYLDYVTKNIKTTMLNDYRRIAKLINMAKMPTIFLEKKRFMDYKHILDNSNINKPIYIYMESAIIYNIEFISEYFSGGVYTFIWFDKRYLMCIKKDNYIIIQPISGQSIDSIKKTIELYSIQISYREWIVSGLINLENEVYIIDKYQIEHAGFALKSMGDL